MAFLALTILIASSRGMRRALSCGCSAVAGAPGVIWMLGLAVTGTAGVPAGGVLYCADAPPASATTAIAAKSCLMVVVSLLWKIGFDGRVACSFGWQLAVGRTPRPLPTANRQLSLTS